MRCYLLIKIFLRFGTAGLYCVTKGRISVTHFLLFMECRLSLFESYFSEDVVD